MVILYRDIRTYGLREDYYKQARDLGVFFVRYDVDRKPVVLQSGSKVQVKAWDYMLNRELQFDADWLVLSVGLRPHTTTDAVGAMYKVTRNPAYYIVAHASKFVRPGSVRIATNVLHSLPNVAFKTSRGGKVLIVLNEGRSAQTFGIRDGESVVTSTLPAGAVGTYVWP